MRYIRVYQPPRHAEFYEIFNQWAAFVFGRRRVHKPRDAVRPSIIVDRAPVGLLIRRRRHRRSLRSCRYSIIIISSFAGLIFTVIISTFY